MLTADTLIVWGGQLRNYQKGKIIFFEGDEAQYFYLIVEGKVKMINTTDEGKDFIQGIFYAGESFGEPPLFTEETRYPATALADSDAVLVRLQKASFFEMLRQHYEIHIRITKDLAERLRFKTMVAKEISCHTPEHRLLTILRYFKSTYAESSNTYEVNLTRQELADLTGLRVETVIRSVKELERKGKLKILNHKIVL